MTVIGIDFGTTASKMAVVDEFGRAKAIPNSELEETTPSVVSFENQEDPIVGRQAANEALARPEDTIWDFKLQLGSSAVLYETASDRQLTATDCAALVLAKLKENAEQFLGEEIAGAVISVPANFQDDQKHALLEAAKQAQINVLHLVHEPTAAAIAYGADKGRDSTILVSDMGGGTYDASIVRCEPDKIEVLGTDGIPDLGGRRYTRMIEEWALDEFIQSTGQRPDPSTDAAFFQDLRDRAEQAKTALSVKNKTTITLGAAGQYHPAKLARDKFVRMVEDLNRQMVAKCSDLLDQCHLTWKELDRVVLVGGGNKVPAVRQSVESMFGRPVSQDIDPLKAISYGAAIQAAVEASKGNGTFRFQGRAVPAPKVKVHDVTAHAIGCCVDDPNVADINAVIIPRHSPIPCEREDVFRLKLPDQTGASIQILQGEEGQPANQCLTIGELTLEELPADPELPKRIRVLYQVDDNGMCTAHAEDLVSGKKSQIQFDYSRGVSRATAS
jgi:molecular chaperone DnaK